MGRQPTQPAPPPPPPPAPVAEVVEVMQAGQAVKKKQAQKRGAGSLYLTQGQSLGTPPQGL